MDEDQIKVKQIYLQEIILDAFFVLSVICFEQNDRIWSTETFVQQRMVLIFYFQDRDYYCYWET